jgi:hypothetical protein
MNQKSLIASGMISLAMLLPSFANAACYAQQYIPPRLSCAGADGNSADFAGGCTSVPGEIVMVATACPPIASNGSGGLNDREDRYSRENSDSGSSSRW